MADSASDRCDVLDLLAEEFAARYRRGERPALKEYLGRYPDLAGDIRALFPALVEMEELNEDQDEPAAPAAAPPLHQIGDYRLLREVGRGGMGVVYEAEQVSLGRRVAVKVMRLRADGDRTALERFRREARAAAKLHHTNIVPVHEVGQDGDVCFYAMQFIQGQSLDQIIEELRHLRTRAAREERPPSTGFGHSTGVEAARPAADRLAQSLLTGRFQVEEGPVALAPDVTTSGPLGGVGEQAGRLMPRDPAAASAAAVAESSLTRTSDPTSSAVLPGQTDLSCVRTDRQHYYRSVARIGWQTAQALTYAHARQIIHRDIKPSNLLLDTAGVVWITDFGLAKTQDAALTTTGDIVGTLRYMAPERFRGEGDERADVYGLGLTLYELLVLRPAFDTRDRLRLIDRIKNEEPARPRAVDPRIPRDLETIILKAMHKEARRRYSSAEELAEDLRRFLADEPIRARRTSGLVRLRLWGRRHPALAGLVLLLAMVAAVSTAMAFYLRATLAESEANRQSAEKAELDGKYELWRSYLTQAKAGRKSREPGQRFASLRAIRAALAQPVPPGRSRDELRTEAIAALCLPDLELDREGGTTTIGARGFTIDPAFQRYAVADKDGRVRIYRLSDDRELLQSPLPGGGLVNEYYGLEFSPDGRYLHQRCQVPGGCRSRLWDLDGPQPRAVLDDDHYNFAFRPDGREFAVAYPDQTVRFFDTGSERELRRFPIALRPDCMLRWSPKLPQLLIWMPTSLSLMNVDTGEVATVGPRLPGGYSWVDWHPEGRLLATAGEQDYKIYLWDITSGRLALPPLEGLKRKGIVMRFNHAGDRLLSTDWSHTWRLWDTRSGQLLLTMPAEGTSFHLSADDRLVGSGAFGKVQVYHFRRGEELRTVVHPGSIKESRGYIEWGIPCVDPGNRLAAISAEGGVALVDLARGKEEAFQPLPANFPLTFETDGTLWTFGTVGLLRWPVAADPKTGQRRYGPPQRTFGTIQQNELGTSTGVRVVAVPDFSRGALVFHRDSKRLLRLGPQEDVRFCAVSPDGLWVATGSHSLREGAGAKVWDARTGDHVKDVPVGGQCRVQFSPDGKWLLTTSGGFHLWAVGSWEQGPNLAGNPLNPLGAFSCDGKLIALGNEPGVVRLQVTDTGAEVARLTAPERVSLSPCCFTPDGTQLLAIGKEDWAVYVFDLRALRAGLAELDLDWDAPSLPAAPAPPATPLSISFDLGDMPHWAEADALINEAARQSSGNEHAKALATLRKAVQIAPTLAMPHNNLAWLLLTGPKELRDGTQALVQARKAVELEPDQYLYRNTLGVALYRTGQLAEAVPVLERGLAEGKGETDAFGRFFLAMCHQRLGAASKAKDCLEAGRRWFQTHKDKLSAAWVPELAAFQAEAEAVLAQPPGKP
jgi:serine/threonine protein kinase/WD40 repeat protein